MATQVYSLVQSYDVGGQFCSNVLHYQFDDSGYNSTYAAAAALLAAWQTTCSSSWIAVLSSDVTFLSLKAKRVSAAGGFEALSLYAGGTVGGRSGTVAVAGVGPVIIAYETANGVRRGKVFLPGVNEGDCFDGQLTAAYRTALIGLVPTMFSNITLAGGGAPLAKYCIYHAKTHQGFLISNVGPSLLLGTQRRRQIPV